MALSVGTTGGRSMRWNFVPTQQIPRARSTSTMEMVIGTVIPEIHARTTIAMLALEGAPRCFCPDLCSCSCAFSLASFSLLCSSFLPCSEDLLLLPMAALLEPFSLPECWLLLDELLDSPPCAGLAAGVCLAL